MPVKLKLSLVKKEDALHAKGMVSNFIITLHETLFLDISMM